MVALVVDTSTERAIICFINGKEVLLSKELPVGYRSSTFLMPYLAECFQSLSIKPQDLSAIAVGIGPGSYTGIRVGVAVAKTIAMVCKVPLISISGLNALVSDTDGKFLILIDAKVSGGYVRLAERVNSEIKYLSDVMVCSLEQMKSLLEGVNVIVTPNEKIIRSKIEKLFPDLSARWLERGLDFVQLAKLVDQKIQDGDYVEGDLDLLYLKPTQAEAEFSQKFQ